MTHKRKISPLEIAFNTLFFLICIVFLFTILFIFSPFSNAKHFPFLSQYIEQYFWTIYSGPVVLAILCFMKKRLFDKKQLTTKQNSTKSNTETTPQPVQLEVYKHER